MSFLDDVINITPRRHLGPIIAQATIEERHNDELTITDHPVEQGAQITDHAFKRPAEVTLRYGWSASAFANTLATLNFTQNNIEGASLDEIYRKLLDLQASREPFDISTGKRQYTNMLIRSLSTTTDDKTENVLFVNVTCREIIIVQTQATTLPPKNSQSKPKKTAQTIRKGVKQLTPAMPSPGGSLPVG